MMRGCRPFSVAFEGDADQLVEKAKDFANQNGGRLSGNSESGSFSAKIMGFSRFEGSYVIDGKTMTVHVTEKPLMLSCAVIEAAVRDKLRGR